MKHFKFSGVCFVAVLWISLLNGIEGHFDANFTLQNVWGRLQPDMRSLIQCLSDENYKKIKFSRLLDTGQGNKLPKSSQQFLQAKPVFARILFMPGDDKLARFGVYQCKQALKTSTETNIITLKLPPSNLVELDAVSPYNVANSGDDVTLEVNVTKSLELLTKWRHNGKELPDWTGLTKVELKNVQVSNAGIYECYYDGRRNEGVHALMRLIVRKCPEDFYGDDCDKECPPCYNGGICQDKWGVCVCPAGFAGENCEIACGGNHFGKDCSKFCSPPQNNTNTDELCALHLFCKPDPYGCSCAPGFKGAKCMEHCEPGWYGADCKQPCHCAYGVSSCNRITGACDGGCARGWRGNSCQIEDPNANNSVETTTMVFCDKGSYGPSCEKQCHCAGNEYCHIITGICPSGCQDGWGGPTCGACKSGRFGDKCEFTCHCEGGHHNCDKEGFCYSGCEAGWAGFTCQTECTLGRFGSNCASTCHCYPNSTKPCDKITGACEGDCEAGFMGKDCQTLCPPSKYGVNCANTCTCFNGAQCSRIDGTCTCEGRWRGSTCNESEPQIVAANGEEVNLNHQVFISCTADAVPEPHMNITCNDFPDVKVSVRVLEQNQLQAVIKLKPEVSGDFEFLCTARNDHGFDMKKMVLTVIDPPRLASEPLLVSKDNVTVSIKWAEWQYSVDEGGSPTDSIEYLVVYKKSESTAWNTVGTWMSNDFADIVHLIPNSEYDIAVKCRRFGKGGEGEPGPPLKVKTDCGVALPNGIPQEFLPEKITQTSVVLTWRNPSVMDLRCPLESYQLVHYPEAADMIKTSINTDGIPARISIDDLTPNTNYVFRLYPVTELAKSKYFAELIIKTLETIPGPASNLECQAVDDKPDLMLVSWDAASEESGTIKGYTVTSILIDKGQCGIVGEHDELQTRKVHSNDTEITLQNLHPFSTYNVSVQARTSAGEGEAISVLANTAESVPSESPRNVRVLSATNTSLEFAWDEIPCEDANGQILHYKYALVQNEDVINVVSGVRVRKRSLENQTHWIFDSIEALSVKINDLKPFTIYGFMVGGATAVGRGVISDIIFHKTEEGVPDEPRSLSIFKVSNDSLGIEWESPHHPNGVISLYKIKVYSKVIDETESEIIHKAINKDGATPSIQKLIIPRLVPSTEYVISVQGSTTAGWGKARSISEKTLDGSPEEPSEVTVDESQQTSLNVSWKEPVLKNGVITGYKIEYQPVSSLDPVFNSTPFVKLEMEVDEDTNEVYLENLHPSTQYSVSVFAKTTAGYGLPATFLCWTVILGDHVSPSLKVLPIEATNETIPIVFSTTGSSSVYKYQVIVEDSRNDDPIDENQLTGFETAVVKKGLPYYIAAELDPSNVSQSGEQTFVVGDKKNWGGYNNVHLNPGHEYKIRIRTLVSKDEELKSVISEPKNETAGTISVVVEKKKTQIAGLDLFVFILILIAGVVFLTAVTFITVVAACFKRNRKKSTTSFSTKDSGLSGSLTWSVMYKSPESDPTFDGHFVADGFRTFPLKEKNASLKRCKSDSKIARGMRIETLEDYLTAARNTNHLTEEFQKLVEGQTSPWTTARKSSNLKKNRYGNILPYDRYRVVLQSESSKGDDDYINASYIDGFRRPKEYIVTQGPLDSTVLDFWRMIWQESCPVIVMITDLVENGKVKCAKYWPDDSMDKGDFQILLIHQEETSDLITRTMLIRKIDEIRTHRVIQYQYTGWPDRNVPVNINSFIKFLKKVRDDHPVMSGPMVVHCSAGAGRSGTYIAIDALSQQAAEDRRVDVFRFVNNARHQRVHLVQTLEQYAFIYEALVEAIQYEDTSIPLQNISLYLKELNYMCTLDRRALILKQYNKLNRTQKKVDVSRCSAALSENNVFKNRDPLTVPSDSSRVVLEVDCEEDEDYGDYINAVFVDGYKKQKEFLVTQMPLAHTVEDFYRLIYQNGSSLILMLNGCDESDEMSVGIYWPELGECKCGDFYIELMAFEEQGDFVIRVLKVTNLRKVKEEPLKVIQLQYNGWTSEMKPKSVLNMIETVNVWYKRANEGPITVHCMDGATRSGLFIASIFVCEQIKNEGALDAFHVVRSIRTNRPEFIPNSDQFRFLFEIAQEMAEPLLLQNEEFSPATKKLSFKI